MRWLGIPNLSKAATRPSLSMVSSRFFTYKFEPRVDMGELRSQARVATVLGGPGALVAVCMHAWACLLAGVHEYKPFHS